MGLAQNECDDKIVKYKCEKLSFVGKKQNNILRKVLKRDCSRISEMNNNLKSVVSSTKKYYNIFIYLNIIY